MLTPKEIAYQVTKALDEKKGMDIKLLKIDEVSTLADYFLICTGTSNTHVKTLCDHVEYAVEQVGSERILFGTDTYSLPFQFGRVVFADLTKEDRKNILYPQC